MKADRPEYGPGYFERKGWGFRTEETIRIVRERDGHICALCGDYTDGNEVQHHKVYRKRRDNGPWPARPEDLVTTHNLPGILCDGQKDLPFFVVVGDEACPRDKLVEKL